MLIIASLATFFGMLVFPFIRQQALASIMLFVLGVFDWAVYMGAAVQALLFGFVKDTFGWPAIFVIIGVLYAILLVLTLIARKMKTKNI